MESEVVNHIAATDTAAAQFRAGLENKHEFNHFGELIVVGVGERVGERERRGQHLNRL